MAEAESTSKMQKLTDIFNQNDEDNDGFISTEALGRILRGLYPKLREARLQQMIKDIDADSSNKISLSEFTSLATKSARTAKQDEFREVFAEYDTDSSGFISTAELQVAMLNLGEKLTTAQVEEMIQQVDKDADGQINYEEFIVMMTAEEEEEVQ